MILKIIYYDKKRDRIITEEIKEVVSVTTMCDCSKTIVDVKQEYGRRISCGHSDEYEHVVNNYKFNQKYIAKMEFL